MKKKLALIIVTVFLLACNALFPPASTPTPEPSARPTSSATVPATSTVPPTETPLPPSDVPATPSAGFSIVRLHPQDGDLKILLAQEAQKAVALGQMPVVEFDATWCPPCRAIEEGLESKNELMLKAYYGTYIIKLDVDEWGWGDSDLHDFEFDGIPVYFKLDAQGQPTGEVIDGGAWAENIPENIAPVMDEFFHGR